VCERRLRRKEIIQIWHGCVITAEIVEGFFKLPLCDGDGIETGVIAISVIIKSQRAHESSILGSSPSTWILCSVSQNSASTAQRLTIGSGGLSVTFGFSSISSSGLTIGTVIRCIAVSFSKRKLSQQLSNMFLRAHCIRESDSWTQLYISIS